MWYDICIIIQYKYNTDQEDYMSNYELDHKLEHIYTLAAYAQVEKKPVSSRNCDRIL